MDVEVLLRDLRKAVKSELDRDDTVDRSPEAVNAHEMAALFHYLDQWIVQGGYLPPQWSTLKPDGRHR